MPVKDFNAYYHANKERISQQRKTRRRNMSEASRQLERDRIKRYRKRWPEREAERVRSYRAHNRATYNARRARERAAKRSATPNWLTEEQHGLIRDHYEVAQLLDLSVDHIIPLAGKNVCGLHVPWNLQLLPLIDNIKKGISVG